MYLYYKRYEILQQQYLNEINIRFEDHRMSRNVLLNRKLIQNVIIINFHFVLRDESNHFSNNNTTYI